MGCVYGVTLSVLELSLRVYVTPPPHFLIPKANEYEKMLRTKIDLGRKCWSQACPEFALVWSTWPGVEGRVSRVTCHECYHTMGLPKRS